MGRPGGGPLIPPENFFVSDGVSWLLFTDFFVYVPEGAGLAPSDVERAPAGMPGGSGRGSKLSDEGGGCPPVTARDGPLGVAVPLPKEFLLMGPGVVQIEPLGVVAAAVVIIVIVEPSDKLGEVGGPPAVWGGTLGACRVFSFRR